MAFEVSPPTRRIYTTLSKTDNTENVFYNQDEPSNFGFYSFGLLDSMRSKNSFYSGDYRGSNNLNISNPLSTLADFGTINNFIVGGLGRVGQFLIDVFNFFIPTPPPRNLTKKGVVDSIIYVDDKPRQLLNYDLNQLIPNTAEYSGVYLLDDLYDPFRKGTRNSHSIRTQDKLVLGSLGFPYDN